MSLFCPQIFALVPRHVIDWLRLRLIWCLEECKSPNSACFVIKVLNEKVLTLRSLSLCRDCQIEYIKLLAPFPLDSRAEVNEAKTLLKSLNGLQVKRLLIQGNLELAQANLARENEVGEIKNQIAIIRWVPPSPSHSQSLSVASLLGKTPCPIDNGVQGHRLGCRVGLVSPHAQ